MTDRARRGAIGIVSLIALAAAAPVAAGQGGAPPAAAGDIVVGEWVGRCGAIGTLVPAADCAVVGAVIRPHLDEMSRVQQMMDGLRGWPQAPGLKPDPATGKSVILYVDYDRSKGGVMADTVGGYSKEYGWISFTQREMGEAAPRVETRPGPLFQPAAGDPRPPQLITREGYSGWRQLMQFSAHELFHAYQATSPFHRSYYSFSRSSTDYSVSWIHEGTAEAAGYLYQAQRLGQPGQARDTSYARALNRTADKGYDRGEFWYLLARNRNAGAPMKFLFDLHKSTDAIPAGGYEQSISWLDTQLRAAGGGLREDYGRVIAQVTDPGRYVPDGVNAYEFPEFEANSPDQAVEVRTDPVEIAGLAASGFYTIMRGKHLQPAEDRELPGSRLVWFELLIDKQEGDERVGLAVADQWVDRKPFTRLILPEGQDIGYFPRATNIDAAAPAETGAASARFNLLTRNVHLRGPGCASVGKTYPVRIDLESNPLGTNPTPEFKAQRGRFTGGDYAAPAGPGPDTLMVKARGVKGDVWAPFAKLDVRSRCNIVIISDDSRMTYDDDAKATRVEGGDGQAPAYIDAKGMVGLNDETGRWMRFPHTAIGGGHPGTMAFFDVPLDKDGLKLNALNQGPLILVEGLKLMRRDVARSRQRATESPAPCPSGGGQCIRFVHPSQPEAGIFFDRAGEPVGFEVDGVMTRIEYDGDPVVVPPA
ncbi:hypothetical protein [Sphingomonas colocasiae]|uniref:Uncharacterized protein n=1 Tax=Sphingomonas colocasiae TaxID=1848973 RepID=A0ABS7PUW6_9SPHN|nr:hypothetical protein [Sphingomonas colocasiae]MBY8825158.1 hypothetical protein [Sphingomonas colocasiae]